MIASFAKLLVFQFLGESLVLVLSLPVPGPVAGMLLMFAYLLLKNNEAEKLAPACSLLLAQLALFFVPAAVGIMLHIHRVAAEWLPIAAALAASTVVSVVVTAAVIRRLAK
ncbi:CidA/LrgA family protein [Herbaspirillum sp. HC18]|nr:CidA/LrgA family protein [Herbaspirillum sp. HC18]